MSEGAKHVRKKDGVVVPQASKAQSFLHPDFRILDKTEECVLTPEAAG